MEIFSKNKEIETLNIKMKELLCSKEEIKYLIHNSPLKEIINSTIIHKEKENTKGLLKSKSKENISNPNLLKITNQFSHLLQRFNESSNSENKNNLQKIQINSHNSRIEAKILNLTKKKEINKAINDFDDLNSNRFHTQIKKIQKDTNIRDTTNKVFKLLKSTYHNNENPSKIYCKCNLIS